MKNIIETLLQAQEINYELLGEDSILMMYKLGFLLQGERFESYIVVKYDDKRVLIFTVYPKAIHPERRVKMAEYITRVNYGVPLGGFEMDFDYGEVRYKSAFVFDDALPHSAEVFRRNLFVSIEMMNKYFPGIRLVNTTDTSPQTAIDQINGHIEPEFN